MTGPLTFTLPPPRYATVPPEAAGLRRDAVRMLVSWRERDEVVHSEFRHLASFLAVGDLLVINTSATIPAAVTALAPDGRTVIVHLSTHLEHDLWVVEPRRASSLAGEQWTGDPPPPYLVLGEGAAVKLIEPYRESARLWLATIELPQPALEWLATHGRAIRYSHVDRPQPLSAYQNVFATTPGSAEMPSAGRPFTPEIITRLIALGVDLAPVVLHTGVASLEAGEMPYPERVVVSADTARRVNAARAAGGRVIAVGTTVVRALESAVVDHGVEPFDGWTEVVISADRPVRVVDGLLTGWHEPEASHLLMIEAIAGQPLLERSYREALAHEYRWHEFGDVHLVLP